MSTVLFNNECFIYECLTIIDKITNKTPVFTFKINNDVRISKVIEIYFDILKLMSESTDLNVTFKDKLINNKYINKWHFHVVDKPQHINLIEDIYKKSKNIYSQNWINQNISQANIWQVQMLDPNKHKKSGERKCRLFFTMLKDNSTNTTIIKPLFIDVNHLIYRDPAFIFTPTECLICHGKGCPK